MEVYVSGDKIYFKSDKVNSLGMTDFTKELWSKIEKRKWNIRYGNHKKKKHPYIYTSYKSKNIDLHRFVMEHWYGKEEMDKAKEQDFIVDHLNNEGLDCQISNLCFIPRTLNTSKGNDYDIRRKQARKILGINIVKDFESQMFQITIVFNAPASFVQNDKKIPISKFFLLYDNTFRRVLYDGNIILNEFLDYNQFNVEKLNCLEYLYEVANFIYLPPEKKDCELIEINGKAYVNMDTGNNFFNQVAPKQELFNKYKK